MPKVKLAQKPTESNAPGWVKDHLEPLDSMKQERDLKRLELLLPGVSELFKELIDMLPNANTGSSEFPVAAGVVKVGESGKTLFISKTLNRVNQLKDSTAHAEMTALRMAEEVLDTKHLDGTYLLSTCEPCAMCCGAVEHTNISGILFATSQTDMQGSHMLVDGLYKPFRASPNSFSATEYLSDSSPNLLIVQGIGREATLQQLDRVHGGFASYYMDPDA